MFQSLGAHAAKLRGPKGVVVAARTCRITTSSRAQVAATGTSCNWHADPLEVLRSLVFDYDPAKCSCKSLSSYIRAQSFTHSCVHYDGLARMTSLSINSLAGNGQSGRKKNISV